MGRQVEKLRPEKDAVIQWHVQAGNIIVDFSLPETSATNVVMWKFLVDDSAKYRYDLILGRDILTELVLNLKFSDHIIEADNSPFIGAAAPMVYLGTYAFKYLNIGGIKPEE